MHLKQLNILLADDDIDDCVFFKQITEELELPINFIAVHDGEQLMQHLINEINILPHVLFLDLNMPRKNGFECLSEIKRNEKLKQLPVIIFSTSFEQGVVDQLFLNGAQYYIRKPSNFSHLKKLIHQTLDLMRIKISTEVEGNMIQSEKENFVLILE